MNIVTGGTGLLGSHLLFELSQSELPIKAMYRKKSRIDLVKAVFQYYDPDNGDSKFQKIQWVKGDILDIPFLEDFIEEGSTVYHCAALVSFNRKDFNELLAMNKTGTENIVNICLSQNAKKLCYASSTAAVVGDNTIQVNEKLQWKKTPETSCYSISKYAAEREVWRGMEEGLDAVIVNPCVILGAGDWNESSLTIFKTVSKGRSFYPPGSNATVDARDVATIMVELVKKDISNERFLCIGSNQSFKELITEIADQLNVRKPSKVISRWQANLVRALLSFASLFTGKRPAMTKETVTSLFSDKQYNNQKIVQTLDYSFYSLNEQVENAVRGQIQSKNS